MKSHIFYTCFLLLFPVFLFGQLEHVLTLYPSFSTDRISMADINNDGIEDVFLDRLGWLPRNADGSLEPMTKISQEIDFNGLVDFDNDGDLDWIYLDDWVFWSGSHLEWFENDGAGNFQERDRIYFGVNETDSRLLADVDLDGLPDVIIVGREDDFGDHHLYWAKQKPDRTFEDVIELNYIPQPGARIVASQKIDNDDFIFYIQGVENLEVIKVETSTQQFSVYQTDSGIENEVAGAEIIFFDFNLDQQLDIVAIKGFDTFLFENVEIGVFEKKNDVNHANNIKFSHLVDIDGDGNLELFLRNNKYLKPIQNGQPVIFNTIPDPIEVDSDVDIDLMYLTELHNDNSIDLIFSHESGVSIQKSFFEQPRNKNPLIFASRLQLYSIIKDIDNNGTMELLGIKGNEIFIIDYEAYGDDFRYAQNFYTHPIEEFVQFSNLVAIDLDMDGDDDIVCEEGLGDFSLIFINDGSNNFSTPARYNYFEATKNNFSDLNNDGVLDAVMNQRTSTINKLNVWLSQNGQPDYILSRIDLPDNLGLPHINNFIDLNNDEVSELVCGNADDLSYSALFFSGNNFDISNPKFLFNTTTSFNNFCLFEKNESTNTIEAFRYKKIGEIIDHFVYNTAQEQFDSVGQVNTNPAIPKCIQDVDNDGDLDLYLWDTNSGSNRLAINTNNTFTLDNSAFEFPESYYSSEMVAEDLNKDGLMDYHNYFGEFSFANSSDPTDFTTLSYLTSRYMREPNYLDLDNDGDLDNISVVLNEVNVRENIGDFQYSNVKSLFENRDYYSSQDKHLPAFYDFNKDGLLDIIAPFLDGVTKFINTSSTSGISFDSTNIQDDRKNLVNFFIQELPLANKDFLLGFNETSKKLEFYAYDEIQQDFVFQSIINIPLGSEIYQLYGVFNHDTDNDGSEEIYLNVTKIGFNSMTLVIDSDWSDLANINADYLMDNNSRITEFLKYDINGDGFLDLLANQHEPNSVEGFGVWYGPEYSNFPNDKKLLAPSVNFGNTSIIDFDRDGDLDILQGTYWHEQFNGVFKPEQKIPYIDNPLFVQNINNDGIIEFFYPHYVYRYDVAANQVLLPTNQSIYSIASELNDINVADINQDGKGDLVLNFEDPGNLSQGNTLYYQHKGTTEKWGYFGAQQKDDLNMYPDEIITNYDFNNDGTNDILQIRYANLSLKLSNQLGGFDPSIPVCGCGTSPYFKANVIVEDIDSDGDLDIFLKSSGIYLLENKLETEPGFFIIHNRGSISFAFNFFLQDMDNDGDFELIFYKNENGAPSINYYSEISFSSSSLGVENKLADLPGGGQLMDADKDGDLDLVQGPYFLDDVSQATIFYNDGDYNFSGEKSILDFDVDEFAWMDISGDGIIDLVVVNETSFEPDEFGVYMSLSNGELGEFTRIDHPIGYDRKLIKSDLDNDLDEDLVMHYNGNVHIFENLAESIKLTIESFIDNNQNGIWDADEYPLGNCKYKLNPNSIFQFPNEFGQTIYSVNEGSYTIDGDPPTGWLPSSGSNSQSVEIENSDKTIQIGYYPEVESREIELQMVAGRQRCNAEAPLWFTIQNNGSSIENISGIRLMHDEKVTPISSDPQYLNAIDDNLTWEADFILYPQQKLFYSVIFQMPDETFTGEFNNYQLVIDTEQLGVNQTNSFEIEDAEVRCSFDPNDKLVVPNRSNMGWETNETLFEETLTYTIRFQNTGNDTAYHVRITDQLDDNLDFESMNVLSSSHPVRTSLSPTGFVTFDFQNIYLVDSLTNPAGSQGYVSFSIMPKIGLDENTAITNCANIYFDFNPPIKTNQIESDMVSVLSTSLQELTPIAANVFPNPIKQGELLQIHSAETPDIINIYHVSGILVDSYPAEKSMHYKTDRLIAGAYYIQFYIEERSLSIPFVIIAN